jgi:hypothetical protein
MRIVALSVTLIVSAVTEPSGWVVSVVLPDVLAVPVIPLTVQLPLVGLTITFAGGVPVDDAVSVQPEIVTAVVPAEAGAAAIAAVVKTAATSAASRAGRSMASPLNR